MTEVARRLPVTSIEFLGYVTSSALALAVDMLVLFLLSPLMHYLVAASVGFGVGAVVNYLLTTRCVFQYRSMGNRPGMEFAVFVGAGFGGLGVSNVVMFGAVALLGQSLLVAKIFAAAFSFFVGFLLRKWMLFKR